MIIFFFGLVKREKKNLLGSERKGLGGQATEKKNAKDLHFEETKKFFMMDFENLIKKTNRNHPSSSFYWQKKKI